MKNAICLLVACGLVAPALAGPPVDEVGPPVDADAAVVLGGVIDDPGDPCGSAAAETITGDNRLLGVDYGWGYYWVTGSGHTSLGSGPGIWKLYQFDLDWNLVETYDQLATLAPWGGRDIAVIESENKLYTGAENGELQIWTFDPSTQRMSGGERVVTGVFDVIRALAYHPGRDTFFTKNFSGGIIEFDRTFTEVGFWSLSISAYGAAYDPINDTIWFNASCPGCPTGTPPPGPNSHLVEWDPNTGAATGRTIDTTSLALAPPGQIGWIVGGLGSYMVGDQLVFVALYQGNPIDFTTVFLGDGTGGCPGGGPVCYADCDDSGTLDFFDFLCFQNEFAAQTAYADCDDSGTHDFFDFLCFQNEFAMGCP
jgi:hypothetical protein